MRGKLALCALTSWPSGDRNEKATRLSFRDRKPQISVNLRNKPSSCQILGFTLIELLVVVAIIGLLIAILIPGLMMAKEAANELRCKTNMGQIYKGAFVFAEDNDDKRLPYLAWGPGIRDFRWVPQVANAIGHFEPGIYKCPSDPDHQIELNLKRTGTGLLLPEDNIQDLKTVSRFYAPISYRGFCDAVDDSTPTGQYLGRKLTDFKRPSEEIMLFEGRVQPRLTHCVRAHRLYALDSADAPDKYTFFYTWERHSGTTNVLFVDGHVDRLIPRHVGAKARVLEFGGIRHSAL